VTTGKRGGKEKRCEGVKEKRMEKNGEQEENLEEKEIEEGEVMERERRV
jgi:hypothetical protein